MREFLKRHRPTIVAFTALIVPLFLLYLHGRIPPHKRNLTIFEHVLLQVTTPPTEAAKELISGVAGLVDSYVVLVDLKEENEELGRKVSLLTAEALRAKELDLENRRLRRLLVFKRKRKGLKTIAAHVIGREVSPYARVVKIKIDVDAGDGVRNGMPVVSSEGLVGRITHAGGRNAEVMLTVDNRSSVDVKVAGKGVTGTLQGMGRENAYTARLLYLHKAEPLAPNDTLVTSGHGEVFPPHIEVGYIQNTEERQRGVYYEVRVAPAVNFSTLEEVMVVIGTTDADVPTDDSDDKGDKGDKEGK